MPRSKPRSAASSDEAALNAAQDLADIADYILEHSPQAALRVRAAILESLQSLVLFPHVGRQQNIDGVRKLVTRRCPYLVYYTTDDVTDEFLILAIRHPAREHSDE